MSDETDENPTTSPEHLRCFILSQITDTSDPTEELLRKMKAIEEWIRTGRVAKKPELRAVT